MNFLTQSETARILRLSERTLERKRGDGTGPRFRKFGRRVVYAMTDLEEWADARTFSSTAESDEDDDDPPEPRRSASQLLLVWWAFPAPPQRRIIDCFNATRAGKKAGAFKITPGRDFPRVRKTPAKRER